MAKNMVQIWFLQIRGSFLILSVMLVLIGIATAGYDGTWHWGHSILLLFGVVLTHVSVNLFNELSDFHTKIDENTTRTPFSGGSGLLQAGLTSCRSVRLAAYTALSVSGFIGIYFCVTSGWLIAVFMLIGGLAICFYTTHFAKIVLGEFISGLTLGSCVVMGVYYALVKELTVPVVMVSVPPGLLTSLLLFLNEFPDMEADEAGGRRHLVIMLGRSASAKIYAVLLAVLYLIIGLNPIFFQIPRITWIAFLTLPVALRAAVIVLKEYDHTDRLIPALGMNVIMVLLTDLLFAVAYFISS